eukprot:199698_1
MENLVKFRLLSNTLSSDEYRTAISNVLNDDNMEEFSCMIFNHFYKKMRKQNASNGLQIDTINQEVTNIISQRRLNETATDDNLTDDITDDESDNDHEPEPREPLNVTCFTDVIIQEIASYLPFKSYSNFQSCCRSIFYAANSPSTLFELDPYLDLEKCMNTENEYEILLFMKKFERINKLKVTGANHIYIPLIQFKNLKHLDLSWADHMITQFRSGNTFNFEAITHLGISNYDDPDTQKALQIFDVIKCCKNLHELHFDGLIKNEQFADVLTCLPNLRALCLGYETYVDMGIVLKDVSNRLQSLTIDPLEQSVTDIPFDSLKELCLLDPSAESIISTIKTMKHLKRLKLINLINEDENPTQTSYKLAFEKIFELSALEYCYVECDYSSDAINLLQLTHCIESSFRQKRETLKLEINAFHGRSTSETDGDIMESSVRLWNALCTWHTSNYMLIVQFNKEQMADAAALEKWLESISKVFSVDRVETASGRQKIVISNKCCVFNGY